MVRPSGDRASTEPRQEEKNLAPAPAEQLQALEEQIRKLEEIRRRWADGEGLTRSELLRRELTLELLDGALHDLSVRRDELRGASG